MNVKDLLTLNIYFLREYTCPTGTSSLDFSYNQFTLLFSLFF